MAAIYKAITSATTTTLITKNRNVNGNINKISICNNSDNAATGISVHLWSGTGGEPVHPFVHNVTIPSGATLVLDDNLSFDGSKFNLRISNAGTNPDITVIIK
tara:strand:- start:20 stop:328 length:309 start_codon:yes stop_codon:yes gene_type:complete